MQAFGNGTPMLAPSGYVGTVDGEKCVGCGACAEACPFGALSVQDGALAIAGDACMGCGVCVAKCPQGALSLSRDPAKGEPLRVHDLISTHAAS